MQGLMIIKVKEPLLTNMVFKRNQTLYTYLHLAAEPKLTKALCERKVTVAYETIQPVMPLLLVPMSEELQAE